MSEISDLTVCEDCSFPPNFAVNCISKKTDEIQIFTIKCRDCGDEWEEQLN